MSPPPPFFLLSPPTVPPPPAEADPPAPTAAEEPKVQSPSSVQEPSEDLIYDDTAPIPSAGEPEPVPTEVFVSAPPADEDDTGLAAAGAGTAAAGTGILRAGTRRGFATFSAGRSFLIGTDEALDFYSYFPMFSPPLRLEQEIGIHPRGGSGLAVSLVAQELFLGSIGPEQARRELGIGARLGGDFPVAPGMGVYASPSFRLGYNLHSVRQQEDGGYPYDDDGEISTDRSHRMDVQFAVAAKILLADRLLLSFRPVDFQIVTDFSHYSLRWSLMGGAGLTF
jgi:hypothetical protein